MSDINFVKKLFNSGLNSITFSIHSHIEEKHDKIVGIKGAFRKTIKAIENWDFIGYSLDDYFNLSKSY